MAIVAKGPMPGNTPISVPSRQPTKAYNRLIGVNATPNPMERWEISSMVFLLSGNEGGPGRELQLERHNEGQVAGDRQDDRHDEDLPELELVARQRGDEGQRDDGCDQAHVRQADARQAAEHQAEHQVGQDDEEQRLPGDLADPLTVFGLDRHGGERHDDANDGHQHTEHQREISRPHAGGFAHLVVGRAPGKRDSDSDEQKAREKVFFTLDAHTRSPRRLVSGGIVLADHGHSHVDITYWISGAAMTDRAAGRIRTAAVWPPTLRP